MSITYNGTEVTDVVYNGTAISELVIDGVTVFRKTKTATEALPFTWYPPATTSSIGYPGPSFTLHAAPVKFVSVTCTDTVKHNTITVVGDLELKWKRGTSTSDDSWQEVTATVNGTNVAFPKLSGGSSSYPQTGTMTFTYEYLA